MVRYDPSKRTSYDLLPKGTYACRVEDIKEKTSERGTKWNIWFRVTEGEHSTRIVFDDVYFYGKGLEHAGVLMAALGRNPNDQQEVHRKELLDLICSAGVDIETYEHDGQTKTRNIVTSYDFSTEEGDLAF